MANEFVARNGLISQNNVYVTGSVTASQGFFGTASFATTSSYVTGSIFTGSNLATSASQAVTASYVTGSVYTSTNPALSASYAATSSVALAVTGGFSKSFAIINNTFIQVTDTGSFNAWRANTPCTASMFLGYRDAGTGAAISASKNGSALVASPLSLATTNGWVSSSTLQNQNFNTGDILTFSLLNFTGSIADITMQVSFTY
jgi:hypothetical protein